ncbi:unannotated protein [freshwater metagenome]|uniref:Unannotated protein n=1 Tax=freshwater metagenome TaxID=449393 RepID=A0A6J5YIP9_9ZZZZ
MMHIPHQWFRLKTDRSSKAPWSRLTATKFFSTLVISLKASSLLANFPFATMSTLPRSFQWARSSRHSFCRRKTKKVVSFFPRSARSTSVPGEQSKRSKKKTALSAAQSSRSSRVVSSSTSVSAAFFPHHSSSCVVSATLRRMSAAPSMPRSSNSTKIATTLCFHVVDGSKKLRRNSVRISSPT